MTNYAPMLDSFRGSDATGNDGNTGRTVTLTQANAVTTGISIIVNGRGLHLSYDFTLVSNVVEFLIPIFDADYIDVNYFYATNAIIGTTEIGYCTVAEVKSTVGYSTSDAPVSDADIAEFILDAQAEIENMYHTKFGNVVVNSTANSGTTSSLTKTAAGWTINDYADLICWIDGGTGVGQYRQITSNTTDTLNVSPNWTTAPDNTSTFKILSLGYIDETLDGSGTSVQFTTRFPLIKLNALTINGVSVTPTSPNVYTNSGKVVLNSTCEKLFYDKSKLQLVNFKYVYGVYPIPRIIKRLCCCLSGIRVLTSQIGGAYADFFSVSLPGISTNNTQAYQVALKTIESLKNEANEIINKTYSPFTLFG